MPILLTVEKKIKVGRFHSFQLGAIGPAQPNIFWAFFGNHLTSRLAKSVCADVLLNNQISKTQRNRERGERARKSKRMRERKKKTRAIILLSQMLGKIKKPIRRVRTSH